jgi:hypothetical protein
VKSMRFCLQVQNVCMCELESVFCVLVCVCVCVLCYVFVCVCVCVRVCMCMYIYACVYIYVCVYLTRMFLRITLESTNRALLPIYWPLTPPAAAPPSLATRRTLRIGCGTTSFYSFFNYVIRKFLQFCDDLYC